jgi:hypothetical protein
MDSHVNETVRSCRPNYHLQTASHSFVDHTSVANRAYNQVLVNQLAHQYFCNSLLFGVSGRIAARPESCDSRRCGRRLRSCCVCCRSDVAWNTIGCPLLLQSLQTRTMFSPCRLPNRCGRTPTWQPSVVSPSPPLVFGTICLYLLELPTSPVLRLF